MPCLSSCRQQGRSCALGETSESGAESGVESVFKQRRLAKFGPVSSLTSHDSLLHDIWA